MGLASYFPLSNIRNRLIFRKRAYELSIMDVFLSILILISILEIIISFHMCKTPA